MKREEVKRQEWVVGEAEGGGTGGDYSRWSGQAATRAATRITGERHGERQDDANTARPTMSLSA